MFYHTSRFINSHAVGVRYCQRCRYGRWELTRRVNYSSTQPLSHLCQWETVIYFYFIICRFMKIGLWKLNHFGIFCRKFWFQNIGIKMNLRIIAKILQLNKCNGHANSVGDNLYYFSRINWRHDWRLNQNYFEKKSSKCLSKNQDQTNLGLKKYWSNRTLSYI